MKTKEFLRWLIVALIVAGGLWYLTCCFYGEGYLVGSLVPQELGETEWLDAYKYYGMIAAVLGMVCGLIWFFLGYGFNGYGSIDITYWVLFIVSIICGVGLTYYFSSSYPVEDVAGYSLWLMDAMPPLIYLISTIIASPDDVKYVPPFAKFIR